MIKSIRWISNMSKGLSPAPGNDSVLGGEERYFGFENFGNTCYSNSVVQALYFCKPFRECVLCYTFPESAAQLVVAAERLDLSALGPAPAPATAARPLRSSPSDPTLRATAAAASLANRPHSGVDFPVISADAPADPGLQASQIGRSVWAGSRIAAVLEGQAFDEANSETLLGALQDLFLAISAQKKRTGVFAPRQFVAKLKAENELFNNSMQQDAHEMFNYLLNAIAEQLLRQRREVSERLKLLNLPKLASLQTQDPTSTGEDTAPATWIHALFEGVLTNETKCLNCETITSRDESFLDLSVDIDQHSSVSSCLRNFSTSEVLCERNKFFCDTCNSLQEAEKRMKIKRLPNVLAVHLKRFKFQEHLGRYSKLSYRVAFPLELRLFNTTDGAANADRLYNLHGIVIHIGSGPHSGHYVALIKSEGQWMLFDDNDVTNINEADLFQYFGDSNSLGTAYFFIYIAADFDPASVVRTLMPESWVHPSERAAAANTATPTQASSPLGSSAAGSVAHGTDLPSASRPVSDERSPSGPAQPLILATHPVDDSEFEGECADALTEIPGRPTPPDASTAADGEATATDEPAAGGGTSIGRGFPLRIGGLVASVTHPKRPSLPTLVTEPPGREEAPRGPATASVADAHAHQSQGSQSQSAQTLPPQPREKDHKEKDKDSGWAWFKRERHG
ncbi:hypothetical protein HK105_200585 [Polyrhizophydium stewartii]|uniref:ubiquitinyl hydrolase 1 n=1 Tax=Polyrhizophydium stewartii TaxID=2732419 RepID=A0ABR4NJF5_9FUNG